MWIQTLYIQIKKIVPSSLYQMTIYIVTHLIIALLPNLFTGIKTYNTITHSLLTIIKYYVNSL